jgi:hypothetical protein
MTADERTGAARPRNASELLPGLRDRLLALDEPVAWDNWDDVVGRSRRARPRRRRVAGVGGFAAVAAALVVVAGPAFGLLPPIIDFGGATHAPAPVQQHFSDFDRAAPPELAPGAIASETRLITSTRLSDGDHTLYVSPTRDGGFCEEWTGAFGGCDQLGTTPLGVTWGGTAIGGSVAAAYVSSVKILFTDGTSAEPTITWLSAPINAGFFLYEAPSGKTPAQVDGFEANGKRVASQPLLGQPFDTFAPPPFAVTDKAKIAAAVSTPDGTATAYLAPSMTAGTCAWVQLDGTFASLYGRKGCLPHGYSPEGLAYRFIHIRNSVLFVGAAPSRYARLELRLPDGATASLEPATGGVFLYSLPAASSRTPGQATITAYGADGRVISTNSLSDAS